MLAPKPAACWCALINCCRVVPALYYNYILLVRPQLGPLIRVWSRSVHLLNTTPNALHDSQICTDIQGCQIRSPLELNSRISRMTLIFGEYTRIRPASRVPAWSGPKRAESAAMGSQILWSSSVALLQPAAAWQAIILTRNSSSFKPHHW